MNCEEVLGALNEYVDRETHSALCQAIREHLADCESCQVVVDNVRQTIELFLRGRSSPFPAGLHEKLLAVMRARWAQEQPAS